MSKNLPINLGREAVDAIRAEQVDRLHRGIDDILSDLELEAIIDTSIKQSIQRHESSSQVKSVEWYKKNWRALELNEVPKIGDVWFGGGFAMYLQPKVLDEYDCFDPVGIQDSNIFRNPEDTTVTFYKEPSSD